MIAEFFSKRTPPGMSLKPEIRFFVWGLVGAFLYSTSFLVRYFEAWDGLYDHIDGELVLDIFEVMPSFSSLLGNALVGFAIAAFCMVGFIAYHYAYFRQGSMSIYLMRRLPQKSELHKRALTLPIIAMILYLIAALIILASYMIFYEAMTPAQCLVPIKQQLEWGF